VLFTLLDIIDYVEGFGMVFFFPPEPLTFLVVPVDPGIVSMWKQASLATSLLWSHRNLIVWPEKSVLKWEVTLNGNCGHW